MFENGYKSEVEIKKWAKFLTYIAIAVAILAVLTALIVLSVVGSPLLALIIFAGGLVLTIPTMVSTTLMYGFAEIVESNKAIAKAVQKEQAPAKITLPEL